jgi:phospholipid-binding lipoprotein MlaA
MLKTLIVSFCALFLVGCASTNAPKADPWEGMNRATFAFNDGVDRAVLTPVAKGYQTVTPKFVQSGISNLFANVGDLGNGLNNLLQGKPGDAISDLGRLLVNSTLGILGLWDVATPMGLEKHNEDFGQTLGKWGVGSGPYVVLPFLGPRTLRDSAALYADSQSTGYGRFIDHSRTSLSVRALDIVQIRADLLATTKTLDEASLDKYQFIRDAYLQRRLNQVHDGKVPRTEREKLEENLEAPDAAPASTTAAPAAAPKPAPAKPADAPK